MIGAHEKDVDFIALDEELFGDTLGNEDDNYHERTLYRHNSSIKDPYLDATTSGAPEVAVQAAPQIAGTSRSGHYTPPLSLPMTPMSPLPTESDQHMGATKPIGNTFLDLNTPPSTASANSEIVAENISWIKNRITDVHQLLLHYLSLRNAHRSMAMDFQKEIILRAETKEALERVREQQDQTSEDVPRLQFQIAQLKLDFQNERAARAAAETCLANTNERLQSYDSRCSLMQTRVSEYEVGEIKWQKEKEELTALLGSLTDGTGRNQHHGFLNCPPHLLTESRDEIITHDAGSKCVEGEG